MRIAPRARVATLVVALLLAVPALLFAHQSLRHSTPEKDARLGVAPRELRLTFNEPVDLGLTRILLLGTAGDTVALGPLELHADSTTVVLTAIRGPLGAGAYRVRWITAGSDGHPTSGDFGFEILPGAEGLSLPVDSGMRGIGETDSVPGADAEDEPSAFDTSSPAYVAIRWLLYLSIIVALGAVAFRVLVTAALRRGTDVTPPWLADAERRAAHIGVLATGALALAIALRLWAQIAAVRSAGLPMDGDGLTTMLTSTAWGWGWMLQLAAAVVLATGLSLAARSGRLAGWLIAAAGGLLLCVTPALSGHAAGATRPALAVTADSLHVLGAGGWLGGLALVLFAGLPAAMRLERSDRWRAVAELVGAFSPAALAFGALVGATGVVAAWIHLGDLTMLWSSGYGRVLLVKLGVLALLGATAAFNWRRVKPRLRDADGVATLRRSAPLELALAVMVLLVTAVLVATPIEPPAP